MNKILLLSMIILTAGCATEPTSDPAMAKKSTAQIPSRLNQIDALKIGMSRSEVVGLLGEPSSVTDTAAAITAVWAFKPNSEMAVQSEPKSNSGLWVAMGNIAATVAGVFVPGVGLAASVGTQVYNASNTANQTSTGGNPAGEAETQTVAVEFREGKAYSIQRSKPVMASTVSKQ